jgi:hypothetical protein
MHRLTLSILTALLVPSALVFAVDAPESFAGFVATIIGIIQTLIALVFVLTFLVIVWGVIKGWVIGGGEAEGVSQGKSTLFAGIVGLVVMFSIWGILELLKSSFFG